MLHEGGLCYTRLVSIGASISIAASAFEAAWCCSSIVLYSFGRHRGSESLYSHGAIVAALEWGMSHTGGSSDGGSRHRGGRSGGGDNSAFGASIGATLNVGLGPP